MPKRHFAEQSRHRLNIKPRNLPPILDTPRTSAMNGTSFRQPCGNVQTRLTITSKARNQALRNQLLQRGTTLIEILVAMIVIAIGLMGIAGLQIIGLKSNNGAYLRSQASLIVNDMADRLRTRRTAALAGNYDISLPASNTCNPAQTYSGTIEAKEKTEWLNLVACMLPSGNASIARSGRLFTITVTWNDTRSDIRKSTASGTVSQAFSAEVPL